MANICVRNHRNRLRRSGKLHPYRRVDRQGSGSHHGTQKTQRRRIAWLDNPTKQAAKELKATSTTNVWPAFSKADGNSPRIARARAREKAAEIQAAIWPVPPLRRRHKKTAAPMIFRRGSMPAWRAGL